MEYNGEGLSYSTICGLVETKQDFMELMLIIKDKITEKQAEVSRLEGELKEAQKRLKYENSQIKELFKYGMRKDDLLGYVDKLTIKDKDSVIVFDYLEGEVVFNENKIDYVSPNE